MSNRYQKLYYPAKIVPNRSKLWQKMAKAFLLLHLCPVTINFTFSNDLSNEQVLQKYTWLYACLHLGLGYKYVVHTAYLQP